MRKRVMAVAAAAILMMSTVGCTPGGAPPGTQDAPPPDSVIAESTIPREDPADDSVFAADSSAAEFPPDSESVAEIRGNIGFLNFDDSDEEKILNIFCSDETFMELVSRYCVDYVQLPAEGEESGEIESDEAAAEGSDPGADEGNATAAESAAGENSPPDGAGNNSALAELMADDDVSIVRGKIGDADVRFIICRKKGEDYLTSLDLSLLGDSGAEANDITDLYLVDAADVQKYVEHDVYAAMDIGRELGIPARMLTLQYGYTKTLGSGGDGVQRAVSYEVSPGVFMYDRQAALDVLGSDEPSYVADRLADWDGFDAVAAEAAERGYAMLADWNDSFDPYAAGISGDWLTETGGVRIDDALLAWTDHAEHYMEEEYYADDKSLGTFGTFISANELMAIVRETDVSAEDFKAQYGICPGPSGWYRGGKYIAVNSESDQKGLCRRIIENVVLKKDSLRKMKAEGILPNNRSVLPEAVDGEASPVIKFLGGQDPYPVFAEAALRVRPGKMSAYDDYLCDVYEREYAAYFAGKKDRDAAMKVFYREVTALISEEE